MISFLKELEISLPNLELVLPQVTFTHEFTILGSKCTARIMTPGGGHSPCDSFLYIQEDDIIFMADLLFVGMHPSFFNYSNPLQWTNILNEIMKLPIKNAVPGHGSVGTIDDINKLRNYISVMKSLSRENINVDEVSIPDEYRDWITINIDPHELFIRNLETLSKLLT
ncbi:MBL fold metallo-hydrolase [Ornithinibacillus scapharcae]|uniref:MBL fold metallo-hydrolase n=1 Tax=Ornithinibacillus scapharcae TaxID=1147159 RepID=UPI000225B568|nr:MBL fold metallo-hydrolase [Ornithinibacillus scapharcae]